MSYRIELNKQHYKPRQATSLHLITGFALCGVGAFTFLLANANWIQTVFHAPLISSTILGSVSLIYGLIVLLLTFFRNKWLQIAGNNRHIRLASTIIGSILAIIFVLSQWWLAAGIAGVAAAANLFAFFYEQKAAQALVVNFNEELILLPATSRRRQLEWKEVERVMLKFGIITIDCADNFLFQWNVKKNDIEIEEFEAFCAAKIEANRSKRDSEDW